MKTIINSSEIRTKSHHRTKQNGVDSAEKKTEVRLQIFFASLLSAMNIINRFYFYQKEKKIMDQKHGITSGSKN